MGLAGLHAGFHPALLTRILTRITSCEGKNVLNSFLPYIRVTGMGFPLTPGIQDFFYLLNKYRSWDKDACSREHSEENISCFFIYPWWLLEPFLTKTEHESHSISWSGLHTQNSFLTSLWMIIGLFLCIWTDILILNPHPDTISKS